MKNFFLILLIYFSMRAVAQDTIRLSSCDVQPKYLGEISLKQLAHDSLVVPEWRLKIPEPLSCSAKFLVKEDGTVFSADIGMNSDFMEKQLAQLFKQLPFAPGEHKGEKTGCEYRTHFTLPIDSYMINRSVENYQNLQAKFKQAAALEQIKSESAKYQNLPPEEKLRKEKELNVRGMYGEGCCQTLFTGMDLNFVELRVEAFLKKLDLQKKGDEKFNAEKPMTMTFDFSKLKVKYVVEPNKDGIFIIQSCDIYGDLRTVLDFYVRFWNTTLQFSDLKEGEVVYNHLMDERVSFKPNLAKGAASIGVRKNK